MRFVVIGGLLVAAMAFALLHMVSHGSDSVAAVAQISTSEPTPALVAPAESPSGAPAVRAPTPRVAQHTAPTAAPTLAPELALPPARQEDPAKPKKIDTPIDKMRWSLMRAIRATEPTVVDCLNQAKQAGVAVDGVSSYFFYAKRQGDKIVVENPEIEASPYADPLKTCLLDSAKDAVVDVLPDDVNRVQVLRRLTVEHGDIAVYKLGAYHIVDPQP